ncbi:hypothetical protein BH11PLA1_BH11PLA1_07450 [soil metagenome]
MQNDYDRRDQGSSPYSPGNAPSNPYGNQGSDPYRAGPSSGGGYRSGGGDSGGYRGGGGGGDRGGDRSGGRGRSDNRGGDRSDARRGPGVPLSELDPALTAVSHKLIGCSRDVHMALGPGYDRATYLHAVCDELRAQGIAFKQDHAFDVKYKGQAVGKTVIDLFIADRFLAQIMAKPGEVGSYERATLRAQLRAADLELGLIINFAGRLLKDGLVRVLNPDKIQSLKGLAPEGGAGAGGADHFDTALDEPGSFADEQA